MQIVIENRGRGLATDLSDSEAEAETAGPMTAGP